MNRHAPAQTPLQFTRRGGARPGAGRPRKKDGGISHLSRPRFDKREPVHATLRVRRTIASLRSKDCFGAIEHGTPVFRATRPHAPFCYSPFQLSLHAGHLPLLAVGHLPIVKTCSGKVRWRIPFLTANSKC